MKTKIIICMVLLIGLSAISSFVMAGDPLEKDKDFLGSDPDGDQLMTWEEFIIGTDPYNADSDNDGLPDWWEYEYSPWKNAEPNALMDPTDPSDAHLDFDYYPKHDAKGYNVGEMDAEFNATVHLKGGIPVTWPANRDIRFNELVFDEDGPHYDNYEEYYRPYTDLEDNSLIRYMHTNPTYSDTDGDGILDPDDSEPLGPPNDGLSPGGLDRPNNNMDNPIEDKVYNDLEIKSIDGENCESTTNVLIIKFEIENDIKQSYSTSQPPVKPENDVVLTDIDNDGIW